LQLKERRPCSVAHPCAQRYRALAFFINNKVLASVGGRDRPGDKKKWDDVIRTLEEYADGDNLPSTFDTDSWPLWCQSEFDDEGHDSEVDPVTDELQVA
jgi:hypothetical protein